MRALHRTCLLILVAALASPAHAGSACIGTVFRDGFEALSLNFFEVELAVTDLNARSATFRLDGNETLTASGDGSYCFTTQVQGGQPYRVEIIEQPQTGNACAGTELSGIVTSRLILQVDCTRDRTEWDLFDWDGANWN